MTTIAHLIETIELGGVLRNLETLMAHMHGVEHVRHEVQPRRQLPPVIPADQLAVIHFTASWSKLPYLAALRAMRGRAPIVIVEHSYSANYERVLVPNLPRFRAMLKLVYSFADRVVAVSHGQGDWLRTAGVVDPAKVVVIPSSTYCGAFLDLPPPARTGASTQPLRIGAYGRYTPQKGFGTLIQALTALPPGLATLQLAGIGPHGDQLKTLAAGLSNVTIGGPTSDVRGFLARCDVIAVPSEWETFGQVALEARAAGRPLIASRVDGLVEQTSDGWGWLVPPGDVAALKQAIGQAACSNLTAMGHAARISTQGHLERSFETWRSLANELLHQGQPSARKAA
jgi:D-inositol-3-phosphate glycosyltransferase